MTSSSIKYHMYCLEKVIPTESNFGTFTYIIYWCMCHVHVPNGLIQHLFLMRVSIWCFTDNWDMSWLSSMPIRQTGTRFCGWMIRSGSVPGAILITPFLWVGLRTWFICYNLYASRSTSNFSVVPQNQKEKERWRFFQHKRIKQESSWNSTPVKPFPPIYLYASMDMYVCGCTKAEKYFFSWHLLPSLGPIKQL